MALSVGNSSPNSLTLNLDTVMTLAYANAGTEIFDTISKGNVLINAIKTNGLYEGVSTMKPEIIVPLMYGLGNMEWYEGWDVLGTQPTEGITDALYEWRQAACPAGYNRREQRLTSEDAIKSLIKVKIEQTKLTMTEGWNNAILQGNVNSPGGNLYTAITSVTTGRSGIEPIGKLIYYDTSLSGIGQPSGALTVGGLDQATYPWWRNWSYDIGSITTYSQLLAAFDLMYAKCSRGPGGPPSLILVDDTTKSLINSAYYQAFRRNMDSDNNYPFDNLKFHNARIVTDEAVCDVENGVANTDTKGTAYFIHPKFMGVKYDTECNFILTDLQKPVNQDGKVGHCMWMGNVVMMNRRKHGVIGNIPRTLVV